MAIINSGFGFIVVDQDPNIDIAPNISEDSEMAWLPSTKELWYWDRVSSLWELADLSGVTADNGLTKTLDNVQLGGELLLPETRVQVGVNKFMNFSNEDSTNGWRFTKESTNTWFTGLEAPQLFLENQVGPYATTMGVLEGDFYFATNTKMFHKATGSIDMFSSNGFRARGDYGVYIGHGVPADLTPTNITLTNNNAAFSPGADTRINIGLQHGATPMGLTTFTRDRLHELQNYTYPEFQPTATKSLLTTDAAGQWLWEDADNFGGDVLTFDNGLTRTLDNVQLGGNLLQPTTIGMSGTNNLILGSPGNNSTFTKTPQSYPLSESALLGGTTSTFLEFFGGGKNVSLGMHEDVFYLDGNTGLNFFTQSDIRIKSIQGLLLQSDSVVSLTHGTSANSYIDIRSTNPATKEPILKFTGNTAQTEFKLPLNSFTQNYTLPISQPTAATSFLTSDAAGQWSWTDASTIGGPAAATITADNGLTKTLDNVQLGGALLLADTEIGVSANKKLSIGEGATKGWEFTKEPSYTGLATGADQSGVYLENKGAGQTMSMGVWDDDFYMNSSKSMFINSAVNARLHGTNEARVDSNRIVRLVHGDVDTGYVQIYNGVTNGDNRLAFGNVGGASSFITTFTRVAAHETQNYTLPALQPTATSSFLTSDASGQWSWTDASTVGGTSTTITADNGLTKTLDNIQLGGALTLAETRVQVSNTAALRMSDGNSGDGWVFTKTPLAIHANSQLNGSGQQGVFLENNESGRFTMGSRDGVFDIAASVALNMHSPSNLDLQGDNTLRLASDRYVSLEHGNTETNSAVIIEGRDNTTNAYINSKLAFTSTNITATVFEHDITSAAQAYILPLAQPTATTSVLTSTAAGQWSWTDASTLGGSSVTVNNGLTDNAGTVQLGGSLIQPTSVDLGTHLMEFESTAGGRLLTTIDNGSIIESMSIGGGIGSQMSVNQKSNTSNFAQTQWLIPVAGLTSPVITNRVTYNGKTSELSVDDGGVNINLPTTGNLIVKDSASADIFTIDDAGTIIADNYGAGVKDATTLSKTESGQLAGFATDGTLLEVFPFKTAWTTDIINANTNDWSPTNLENAQVIVRLGTTVSDITGIDATAFNQGDEIQVHNRGTSLLTFKHADTNSIITNRFSLPSSLDASLVVNGVATFIYNGTNWFLKSIT